MTDKPSNLSTTRQQSTPVDLDRQVGGLVSRIAGEAAKHLPKGAVPDANALTPNTQTQISPLSFAETVLQKAAESKYPTQQATAELGTYADLAEQEAPGNPYSAQLMSVVEMLELGQSVEQVLSKVQKTLARS